VALAEREQDPNRGDIVILSGLVILSDIVILSEAKEPMRGHGLLRSAQDDNQAATPGRPRP
jgi:hypothetical protein